MLYEEEIISRAANLSRYVRRNGNEASLALERPFSAREMKEFLDNSSVNDEQDLFRVLRQLRKEVMLRLICRDLGSLADFHEVVGTATALAEESIRFSLFHLDQWMRSQYGEPIGDETGKMQAFHVVGMGKLGGAELNVSSDIDLIFAYAEEGQSNGAHSISNHEYFTRLGRKLISSLNERTEHGFVFRVDMRLRPYGESGALVSSFSMLEEYFHSQGREWERYAWIKGRVISGDRSEELDLIARGFVFRKYFDFGAYESIRDIHSQIRQQVKRKEMVENIKLGPGGIREIEFIAQVFQLIRGGRDVALQARATLQVLGLLQKKRQLPGPAVEKLSQAYVFLRNLEHRLQYLDDEQTQDLPTNEEDRGIIAQSMGFPDFASFRSVLEGHRTFVQSQFEEIFSAKEKTGSETWPEDEEAAAGLLESSGFAKSGESSQRIHAFLNSGRYQSLFPAGRKKVDILLPKIVEAAAMQPNPDRTLLRMLGLLEAIGKRSAYLSLLLEYPASLEQIARLANASQWASDYLCLHPILLDELLDPRQLYSPPDWADIEEDLMAQLSLAGDDVEKQMDVLRHVHHSVVFGLLAKDLNGLLGLEILSDHLSALADLILRQVLRLCWHGLRYRHRKEPEFSIIGYGKLGGKELGYASDLDIIFLYRDEHPDAPEVYARLAQRINTWLSSHTSAGSLYETDLRLRPNGSSGLLVSSVEAFEEYQEKMAWVWEHQALTRARHVAGSPEVGEAFERIRMNVLRQKRVREKLKNEILSMRRKMLDSHPNPTPFFDLKHDRGGIVDVEFIVQFHVLLHSHEYPDLTRNSGNIALLDSMGKIGIIDRGLAAEVQDAYRKFRRLQHELRLNNESYARVEKIAVEKEAKAVLHLWGVAFSA